LTELTPDELDAWLRERLGRSLLVALISLGAAGDAGGSADSLADMLSAYRQMRTAIVPASSPTSSTAFDDRLTRLAQLDPDVVLVCPPPLDAEALDLGGLRALRDNLDQSGVLDRAFVAVVSASISRLQARRLGFEDAISPTLPPCELGGIVAREGVAADERRRGSSPPCFL
jgi:hypothetical protein